jgi:glyoxylase-like metal-dependent hydrolase (beta-lactamase superfamily II)
MRLTRDVYLVGDGMRGLSHPLDCCVYVIDCGEKYVMIDSGVGLAPSQIVDNIREDGIDLKKIKYLIVTHSHADHACGASYFQNEFQVEVLAPSIEADLMAKGSDSDLGLDVTRGTIYPNDFAYKHCKPDIVVNDQEELKINNKILKFIQVPGHSPGIACILVKNEGVLFSSDVVFHSGTIGLGSWAGCDLTAYRKNIGKLAGLGVEKLFPGHFLFVLRGGQTHIDLAISNLKSPWIPPAWLHRHPHV